MNNMNKIASEIQKNILKTNLILAIFAGIVGSIFYLILQLVGAGNNSFYYSLGFSLITTIGSYYFGPNLILSLHQAKKISPGKYPDYQQLVAKIAHKANLPLPNIYIIDSAAPNAFATGRNPQNSVICATTGLLNTLNREELEAVIAHEIGHIRNYDIRLMAVVSIIVGSLSSAIHYLQFSSMFGINHKDREKNPISDIVSLLLILIAPLIATLIQLAISRQREFLADASSAELTHQPQNLISALNKIHNFKTDFQQLNPAMAALYIHNPFSDTKILELFSTHPSLEKRVAALKKLI